MYDTTKPYTNEILELVKSTWKEEHIVHSSTDGIGTKGIYHWQKRTFRNAVLDALAMNLNDLVVMRVKPTELHDHIMIPNDDKQAIYGIIFSLAEECRKRGIEIDSGETSIHDNLSGLEISVTIDGLPNRSKPNKFDLNDFLIGIRSNGLHSNGFTKVRNVFGDEFRQEFVEPTAIYSDVLFDLIDKFDISGMVHITGGAYTKLIPLLDNLDAIIQKHRLNPQKIFYELQKRGVSDEEMYKTFNCGVGFILGVKEDDSRKIISELAQKGFDADVVGQIVQGRNRVKISSMFSDKIIEY